jgi:hypothetical protein
LPFEVATPGVNHRSSMYPGRRELAYLGSGAWPAVAAASFSSVLRFASSAAASFRLIDRGLIARIPCLAEVPLHRRLIGGILLTLLLRFEGKIFPDNPRVSR